MSNATGVHANPGSKYACRVIPLWAFGVPQPHISAERPSVRKLLGIALTFAAFALLVILTAFPVRAAENVVRIGFQKYGTLVLLKEKGLLEEKLKPLGYTVEWTEFPGGP